MSRVDSQPWGTPGSSGEPCRFNRGASTGPDDTSHLEDDHHTEGNPGGSPPELNITATIHGGFGVIKTTISEGRLPPLQCNLIRGLWIIKREDRVSVMRHRKQSDLNSTLNFPLLRR